jgi:MFS transporter, PCFT/HCP family, solute carrier family 46, member 3
LTYVQIIRKVFTNITVEPLVVCWILPFLITYAATENMNLEKGCRELVTDQIGFTKDACKLFVRKDEYSIKCATQEVPPFSSVKNDEIKKKFPELFASIEINLTTVYSFLCEVEEPVQQKLSKINSIRNPISSIGPLIIILFAGPWSDKKNLRVPCMLVPFLGEAIGFWCELKTNTQITACIFENTSLGCFYVSLDI